jgi:hypothetical protein
MLNHLAEGHPSNPIPMPWALVPGAPSPTTIVDLGPDRQTSAGPVVGEQMECGGVRLAAILNEVSNEAPAPAWDHRHFLTTKRGLLQA